MLTHPEEHHTVLIAMLEESLVDHVIENYSKRREYI